MYQDHVIRGTSQKHLAENAFLNFSRIQVSFWHMCSPQPCYNIDPIIKISYSSCYNSDSLWYLVSEHRCQNHQNLETKLEEKLWQLWHRFYVWKDICHTNDFGLYEKGTSTMYLVHTCQWKQASAGVEASRFKTSFCRSIFGENWHWTLLTNCPVWFSSQ